MYSRWWTDSREPRKVVYKVKGRGSWTEPCAPMYVYCTCMYTRPLHIWRQCRMTSWNQCARHVSWFMSSEGRVVLIDRLPKSRSTCDECTANLLASMNRQRKKETVRERERKKREIKRKRVREKERKRASEWERKRERERKGGWDRTRVFESINSSSDYLESFCFCRVNAVSASKWSVVSRRSPFWANISLWAPNCQNQLNECADLVQGWENCGTHQHNWQKKFQQPLAVRSGYKFIKEINWLWEQC